MKASMGYYGVLVVFVFVAIAVGIETVSAGGEKGGSLFTCPPGSPCYDRCRNVRCPAECPSTRPANPQAKFCYLDCYSRKCEAVCKSPKHECDGKGSGCYDPRFVGGDGVMFYFHGRKGEHFTLVSDTRFQINARFIGLRPAGRSRDFTWIQALGFMFGSHRFTVDAVRAERWDDAVDHLRFVYDGEPLELPEGHRSSWRSPDGLFTVERIGRTNSVTVKLEGMAEALLTVVPVTEEDDRIHKYQKPTDDCLAHMEVQFRFQELSAKVEGVLGRTYQPDYLNPAKRGVAMPVLGGEDKYWTPSLLSPRCSECAADSRKQNCLLTTHLGSELQTL
ncbi:hypothetical protein Taro_044964 [Colocasia esculenta]|uniref:Uncharacterized protein n=1 Tax=Colocasia esculenta TaxID=4460 RepID=A0A843WN68_COLES|nr:hypothetical protein [Colocasia esculenta]